jgi:hypothetical protein
MNYGLIISCNLGFNGFGWIKTAVGRQYLKEQDTLSLEFCFSNKNDLIQAVDRVSSLSLTNFSMILVKNDEDGTSPIIA